MIFKIINKINVFFIMFSGYALSYNFFMILDKYSDFVSLKSSFPIQLLIFWVFVSLLFIRIEVKK